MFSKHSVPYFTGIRNFPALHVEAYFSAPIFLRNRTAISEGGGSGFYQSFYPIHNFHHFNIWWGMKSKLLGPPINPFTPSFKFLLRWGIWLINLFLLDVMRQLAHPRHSLSRSIMSGGTISLGWNLSLECQHIVHFGPLKPKDHTVIITTTKCWVVDRMT